MVGAEAPGGRLMEPTTAGGWMPPARVPVPRCRFPDAQLPPRRGNEARSLEAVQAGIRVRAAAWVPRGARHGSKIPTAKMPWSETCGGGCFCHVHTRFVGAGDLFWVGRYPSEWLPSVRGPGSGVRGLGQVAGWTWPGPRAAVLWREWLGALTQMADRTYAADRMAAVWVPVSRRSVGRSKAGAGRRVRALRGRGLRRRTGPGTGARSSRPRPVVLRGGSGGQRHRLRAGGVIHRCQRRWRACPFSRRSVSRSRAGAGRRARALRGRSPRRRPGPGIDARSSRPRPVVLRGRWGAKAPSPRG